MDNSIALWWSNNNSKVNLDVNVFISKDNLKNYIEFGIKIINDIQSRDNFICLYLPYKISENDVQDKTPELIENVNLTKVLFNEDITIETDTPNITIIKFKNRDATSAYLSQDKNFRYMSLNECFEIKDVKVKNKIVGSYIKIFINNNHTSDEYKALYYRFRIKRLAKIKKEIDENYFFIDGLIRKTIFFDFNVNKQDKLPLFILNEFEKYNFDVNKVNVFLKTDMSTNIIFQSKQHKNIKVLANIWREYIGVDDGDDDILVYHWKEKDIFAKLNHIRKNILFYIVILGIIIIINLFSNFIFDWLKG